ncbi:MAG: NapC/NirT family cytochrome c, partial [Sedimenticola sp.]|nr:NapC/NirT family cytochrome c [Sedimenticola sp.]
MNKGAKRGVMGLLIVGIVLGIILWGGFNTAMEATNNEQFCIS